MTDTTDARGEPVLVYRQETWITRIERHYPELEVATRLLDSSEAAFLASEMADADSAERQLRSRFVDPLDLDSFGDDAIAVTVTIYGTGSAQIVTSFRRVF